MPAGRHCALQTAAPGLTPGFCPAATPRSSEARPPTRTAGHADAPQAGRSRLGLMGTVAPRGLWGRRHPARRVPAAASSGNVRAVDVPDPRPNPPSQSPREGPAGAQGAHRSLRTAAGGL